VRAGERVIEGGATFEVRQDVARAANAHVREVRLHLEAVLVAIHDLAREDADRAGDEREQRLARAASGLVELVALELQLRLGPQRDAGAIDHHELHVAIGAGAQDVALAHLREEL
jgi:hypothetical protein